MVYLRNLFRVGARISSVTAICIATLLFPVAKAGAEETSRAWDMIEEEICESGSTIRRMEGPEQAKTRATGFWMHLRKGDRERWPIESVLRFLDDVVVKCDGYKIVDVPNRRLVPLVIENCSDIHSIYVDRQGSPYALCTEGGRSMIKYHLRSKWRSIPVPKEVTMDPDYWSLAADNGNIALVSNEFIYSINRTNAPGKWRTTKYDLGFPDRYPGRYSRTAVTMCNSKIYCSSIGNACGAGGWIKEIKIDDGTTNKLRFDGTPRDMRHGPDGALWFVTDRGQDEGRLYKYKNNRLTCVARADSREGRVNWPFANTSFEGLSLKGSQKLLMATENFGVLSYTNYRWMRMTPEWPTDDIACCGIACDRSGTIIVPIYHRGIVLVQPDSGTCIVWLPDIGTTFW